MRHSCRASWIVVILLLIVSAATIASESTPKDLQANQTLGSQPIAFTKNMGQWPDSVLFRADAAGAVMWFVKNGNYYQYTKRIPRLQSAEAAWAAGLGPRQFNLVDRLHREPDSLETTMIKAEFVGANQNAEVVGREKMDYKCNYFIGDDPAKWRTQVPNYSGIRLKDLYPGVEVTFRDCDGRLECVQSGYSILICAMVHCTELH